MCEIWHVRNPDESVFSWMRSRPNLQASRIDFAIVSISTANSIENITYCPGVKTDHLALFIALNQVKFERGPGYWKFNNTLLSNIDFVNEMNENITNCINKCQGLEVDEKWIILSKEMKEKSKSFSKNLAAEKDLIISQLSEKVMEMEFEISKNYDENQYQILINTKVELENLLEEKNRGIIFRTKCWWYEHGEINSKMFFNMEKIEI